MVALVICAVCMSPPNTEALQVTTRRGAPIRKQVRRKKRASLIPAPLSAKITYGDLTPEEEGGQLTGALNYGANGQIRIPQYDPFLVAHELFHVLDAQVLTDADRARFAKILRTKGPWDSGTGTEGFGSPMEIASDYYAMLATKVDPERGGVASYVNEYSPKRLRRFGNSLERLLKRRGLSVLDLDSYR